VWQRRLKELPRQSAVLFPGEDDSGTHVKEQAIWRAAGIPLVDESSAIMRRGNRQTTPSLRPADQAGWYLSVGQGMGRTLLLADEKQAYTLADRGTYLKYAQGRDRPISLSILQQGDPVLNNPYSIIPINPAIHPHVRYDVAMRLVEWITSARGQELIASYRLHGKPLFFPDVVVPAKQQGSGMTP